MNNSLKVLLTEIIDYAGLFPPSQVTMAAAVQNFDEYLRSENGWMLGRFVVPITRLSEFSKHAKPLFDGERLWRLSVLASEDLVETLKSIERFNKANDGNAKIDSLEIKVIEAREIKAASELIPNGINAYFEFPQKDVLTDFITILAITKHRAKIRTGGITHDAFPSTDAIIRFMRMCVAANIPFKATAGLHHPLRCVKPLTYEENSDVGTMNGFLNLFLSACLLRQNLNTPAVHRLMGENSGDDFAFNDEGIAFAAENIQTRTIALARQKNAISFGSCSFLEPIEALQKLSLI